MAVPFSRPDDPHLSSVADKTFGTTRRGYDQAEVRAYLSALSADIDKLQRRVRTLETELDEARAAQRVDPVMLDEDTLTRVLGEETARVLTAARESAAEIRSKAEESAARMLSEASDDAGRIREEAETEAARRRADAQADAEAEVAMAKQQGREMVSEARAYRERVLSELARRREMAREQIEQLIHGRDRLMQAFERARLVAVDVVGELSPIDEPDAYVNLAPTTGPVPLTIANERNAARRSVPTSDRSAIDRPTEPVPVVEPTTSATAADPAEAVADADPAEAVAAEPAADTAPAEDVAAEETAAVDVATDDAATDDVAAEHVAVDDAAVADPAIEDVAVDDVAAEDTVVEDTVATDADLAVDKTETVVDAVAESGSVADAEAEAEPEAGAETPAIDADVTPTGVDVSGGAAGSAAGNAETTVAGEADEAVDDDGPSRDVVVDLFARLRAGTEPSADATAAQPDVDPDIDPDIGSAAERGAITSFDAGELPTATSPGAAAVPTASSASSDEGAAATGAALDDPFRHRDAEITPVIVACARKIKRVLADEQNEVLDRLRRSEPVESLDALVPWQSEQLVAYTDAIADELLMAAHAGAASVQRDTVARLRGTAAADAVAAGNTVIDNWLIVPLRERLDRAVAASGGDNQSLTRTVRSLYREWKTQRIDERLDDIVRAAYGRGVLAAFEPGSPVAWALDPEHDACADCADNTLAGAVPAGAEFPTGDVFAPAHPGCRCLLVQNGR